MIDYSHEEQRAIADTIIQQMGGFGKITAMTSANTFLSHPEGGVSFKFKGSRKANYVKIILNSMDLYDLEFGKIGTKKTEFPGVRMPTYKVVREFDGAYNDMLKSIFEETTGLYLSL